MAINTQEVEVDQTSASASEAYLSKSVHLDPPPPESEPYPRGNGCGIWSNTPRLDTCQCRLGPTFMHKERGCPSRLPSAKPNNIS